MVLTYPLESSRHEARHVDADFFKEEWTTLDVFAQLASER
ncbi:hypothetical protein M2390_001038 [Mycetocola sp. BIGb0189]|nr:hypothetical protein [Mycetocola sp. BIGb0189]